MFLLSGDFQKTENLNFIDFIETIIPSATNLLRFNSKDFFKPRLSNHDLIISEVESFKVSDFEKKTYNCRFEKTFFQAFLSNPLYDKPLNPNDKLLNTLPDQYKPSKIMTYVTENKLKNTNNNYTPSNLLKKSDFNKKNYFYVSDLSFNDINQIVSIEELNSIQHSLANQAKLINTLRWSYRYNNLHRRTMYNSHKITTSKKLISSGFFDLNLTKSNL